MVEPVHRVAVFDIETVGTTLDEIGMSPKWIDYHRSKIEKKRAVKGDEREDTDKEKDFCALDTDLTNVVCICVHDGDETHSRVISSLSEEQALIKWFWDVLGVINPKTIVSFNGKAFDAPIVVKKSIKYDIEPTVPLTLDKYDRFHVDLADTYGAGAWGSGSLKKMDFYSNFYLNSGVEEDSSRKDGSEIAELWHSGQFDEIVRKCSVDVQRTHRLYQKMRPFIKRY
jgi:uncharacterized protein YprB with RNaseH-like and TPR domain